jgi:hypothetical protein
MGDILKKIPEWIWKKIAVLVKVPRAVAGILTVLILTCLIIFCNSRYVSVPGSVVSLRLGQFERCKITFKNDLSFDNYEIGHNIAMTNFVPGFQTNTINLVQPLKPYISSTLIITNLWYLQQKVVANTFPAYDVNIFTVGSIRCDITAFSIDDEPVNLKEFIKHNLGNQKSEYVHLRYIRKDLAQIIYRWNDEVSNWILTGLAAGMWLFLILLLNMERKTFTTDKYFVKGLEKLLKMKIKVPSKPEQQQIAYDRFHDICAQWNSRFIFLQALGPALGFILTVSSLIASLDPATFSGAGTDLDAFLNGIHVALVSTFLGLLLRILALEAARVNLLLLRRAHVILSVIKSPSEEVDSNASQGGSSK